MKSVELSRTPPTLKRELGKARFVDLGALILESVPQYPGDMPYIRKAGMQDGSRITTVIALYSPSLETSDEPGELKMVGVEYFDGQLDAPDAWIPTGWEVLTVSSFQAEDEAVGDVAERLKSIERAVALVATTQANYSELRSSLC